MYKFIRVIILLDIFLFVFNFPALTQNSILVYTVGEEIFNPTIESGILEIHSIAKKQVEVNNLNNLKFGFDYQGDILFLLKGYSNSPTSSDSYSNKELKMRNEISNLISSHDYLLLVKTNLLNDYVEIQFYLYETINKSGKYNPSIPVINEYVASTDFVINLSERSYKTEIYKNLKKVFPFSNSPPILKVKVNDKNLVENLEYNFPIALQDTMFIDAGYSIDIDNPIEDLNFNIFQVSKNGSLDIPSQERIQLNKSFEQAITFPKQGDYFFILSADDDIADSGEIRLNVKVSKLTQIFNSYNNYMSYRYSSLTGLINAYRKTYDAFYPIVFDENINPSLDKFSVVDNESSLQPLKLREEMILKDSSKQSVKEYYNEIDTVKYTKHSFDIESNYADGVLLKISSNFLDKKRARNYTVGYDELGYGSKMTFNFRHELRSRSMINLYLAGGIFGLPNPDLNRPQRIVRTVNSRIGVYLTKEIEFIFEYNFLRSLDQIDEIIAFNNELWRFPYKSAIGLKFNFIRTYIANDRVSSILRHPERGNLSLILLYSLNENTKVNGTPFNNGYIINYNTNALYCGFSSDFRFLKKIPIFIFYEGTISVWMNDIQKEYLKRNSLSRSAFIMGMKVGVKYNIFGE